jgi:hypothetical protein
VNADSLRVARHSCVPAFENRLGIITYGWDASGLHAAWATRDIGEDAAALRWLASDLDGDSKAELIQLRRNGSRLGAFVYGWGTSSLNYEWGTDDLGHGYGALAWLTADLDADGRAEIIQPWRNGSQLGFVVYGWDGSRLVARWATQNIGQGYGALAWLTADLDADGRAEIIQPWRNGSQLGFIVYGWDGTSLVGRWATQNIGQGYGALAWLTADLDADGRAEIIQPWRNGSKLGFLVYGWDGTRLVGRWGTQDTGYGYGALAWLTADLDADGRAEIIQPWRNGSQLGFMVYQWDGTRLVARWGSPNVGQGYGALAWLTADLDADGWTEIIQPWRNGSQLGFIVYGWNGTLVPRWATKNIGQGYGALAWLAADISGNHRAQILQPWPYDRSREILAEATQILKTKDSTTDHACNVTLSQRGSVRVFARGNGVINSEDDYDEVQRGDANVKVVCQINWCDGINPTTIGCAPVGGDSMVVERFTPNQEGSLWAHEYGHNCGIEGDYNIPNRVMNATIAPTNREVTAGECEKYR